MQEIVIAGQVLRFRSVMIPKAHMIGSQEVSHRRECTSVIGIQCVSQVIADCATSLDLTRKELLSNIIVI